MAHSSLMASAALPSRDLERWAAPPPAEPTEEEWAAVWAPPLPDRPQPVMIPGLQPGDPHGHTTGEGDPPCAGERWCPGCCERLHVLAFAASKSASNGLQTYCRDCSGARK